MPYLPFEAGQMVCNAFDVNDCMEVTDKGLGIAIMEYPKIYLPKTSAFFSTSGSEEKPEISTV